MFNVGDMVKLDLNVVFNFCDDHLPDWYTDESFTIIKIESAGLNTNEHDAIFLDREILIRTCEMPGFFLKKDVKGLRIKKLERINGYV